MPGVFGDEYRSAFLKGVAHIVQDEDSAAFQNVEGFVHLEVPVNRNPCTHHDLLGPQGKIAGACGGADFYQDLAAITKVDEMLAFVRAEYIFLPSPVLSSDGALRQHLSNADDSHAQEERSTILLE